MDWYAWLSKAAGLSPAVTYEYAVLLGENELEPRDAPHFDHDLLQSIGIRVAKHRLEILKLARKPSSIDSSSTSYARVRLEGLARKAGRCLARCARRIASGGGRRGLSSSSAGASMSVSVAVPRICNGGEGDVVVRAGAVRRRTRRRKVGKMVLMITDGGGCGGGEGDGGVRFEAASAVAAGRKASLMFHGCGYEDEEEDEDERLGHDEEDAAGGGREIKWDSMFQDLKPT
ncbi:uncharacterized protein LOC100834387 [Brachypodium distachyon]|uniref:SAM domain-containing protein n=1 Tax=Brachypodium distachyon TaxID=15368 RepID=I1GVH0_BRADI|nr:uncharacterized protein LOC100834387 [Brachypodium distachyon]KQK16789.1 hypothetical protein BRADI_1g30620v3 [Brachypodium distachyon]|eukprot:XP_003563312.1 uncharacterized protein LOC100834387 [Brachypodium distachyon]